MTQYLRGLCCGCHNVTLSWVRSARFPTESPVDSANDPTSCFLLPKLIYYSMDAGTAHEAQWKGAPQPRKQPRCNLFTRDRDSFGSRLDGNLKAATIRRPPSQPLSRPTTNLPQLRDSWPSQVQSGAQLLDEALQKQRLKGRTARIRDPAPYLAARLPTIATFLGEEGHTV